MCSGWHTVICLSTAKNCGVLIRTNAFISTTMLRLHQCEISWQTITMPNNNVVELRYHTEKLPRAPSEVKEDFVIYLVSQAGKSFNLFYCNLTAAEKCCDEAARCRCIRRYTECTETIWWWWWVVDRMDEGSIKTSRNVNVTERLFISTCLVFVCYSVER